MNEKNRKTLKDFALVGFFIFFSAGMFWWGLETRTVENYVCVTFARESGNQNPPYRAFSWVSNISCIPVENNNFSCPVGELYLYQQSIVLDQWIQEVK